MALGRITLRKDGAARVQHAISDLLRQFGILPSTPLIDIENDGVDPQTWLTAFYALRRTRRTTANNLPNTVVMMVRVNPVEAIFEVTTPSLFKNNPKNFWFSYPEALRSLLSEKWEPNTWSDSTVPYHEVLGALMTNDVEVLIV